MVKIHVKEDGSAKKGYNLILNEEILEGQTGNKRSIYFTEPGLSRIYLKGRFVKTNSVVINLEDEKKYSVVYIDNFIFIFCYGIFMFLLLFMDFKLRALNFELGLVLELISIMLMILGFTFFWNDLLFLGRKISVVEKYEKSDDPMFDEII